MKLLVFGKHIEKKAVTVGVRAWRGLNPAGEVDHFITDVVQND